MSLNFWLAVVSGTSLFGSGLTASWWCLPYSAAKGDRVLIYKSRHGIFAEAVVSISPNRSVEDNRKCSSYGSGLGHAELEIVEKFSTALAAKHMKNDVFLRHSSAVKKNFQGTTFSLDEPTYQRMRLCLSELATAAKNLQKI